MGGIFAATALVSVVGLLSEGKTVGHVLTVAGFILLLGLIVALRVGVLAKTGARNLVLARQRAAVERNPGAPLTRERPGDNAVAVYGQYPRTVRYAVSYLKLVGCVDAIVLGLGYTYGFSGKVVLLGVAAVLVTLGGVYLLLDRRTYVDISAEGVWCRAWGRRRLAYTDFKAVYPRQNRRLAGVCLVPADLPTLKRKLSWFGRLGLRGGGVPAHIGTLTLWSTQIGLSRDALLRSLQAEIVAVARVPKPQ